MQLTANALAVLKRRYLKRDQQGNIQEEAEGLFRRVAGSVARAELQWGKEKDRREWAEKFYQIISSLEFMPNSPTLMNAGKRLGQLSACFVLPVEDSLEGIFNAVKYMAIIHQSGGGTGFSFSHLRPKNDIVGSTHGVSSGPVSFIKVFDSATETIKQGGTRRGANMAILRVDHPDILEFVTAKADPQNLTNFNISVGITDEFMRALRNKTTYSLISPRTRKVTREIEAPKVFDLITQMAWQSGEPGLVFLDVLNRFNPTPGLGPLESTNPCGEQPLLPWESCNLGSINLGKMVKEENGRKFIDFPKLKKTVEISARFLDDVVEVNRYPLPPIKKITLGNRKIGLGVMGFADLLIHLGLPYNSPRALKVGESIARFILREARKTSLVLAEKRGVFPNFRHSIYYKKNLCLRNATLTTVAPTGTISIIADCSSGIEPLFGLKYVHRVFDGEELVRELPFPVKVKDKKILVTAQQINPVDHIRMQAVFQKYVDNAVSKTINFPEKATRQDVARAYLFAYQSGCKGITVYRQETREKQPLISTCASPSCS